MGFTPTNANIYLRAQLGALAGMATSAGNYPTDPTPGDYSFFGQMADAYGQAVDGVWASPAATNFELEAMQEASASIWRNRSPLPTAQATTPGAYSIVARAAVAMVRQGKAQVVSQGVDPNASQGSIGATAYTPAVPGNWNPPPTTVAGALDTLAALPPLPSSVVQGLPSTAGVWAANTNYSVGQIVQPTAANATGFWYTVTVAGLSGASEPKWPAAAGATIVDNTVTWSTTGLITVVPGAWQTALDFDFTAQPTTSFNANGNVNFGGLTWKRGNTAGDQVGMTNTNGTGLNIQPVQTTDYNGVPITLPYLWLPISSVSALAKLTLADPVRLFVYTSAENYAANFDDLVLAIDDNGTFGNPNNHMRSYVLKRGFPNGYSVQGEMANGGGCTNVLIGNGVTQGYLNARRVTCLELPFGIGGGRQRGYFGAWGPGISAIKNYDLSYVVGQFEGNSAFAWDVTNPMEVQNFGFLFGAHRSGSGTALSITIARMRIDIFPTG